ncbi:MAG: histidine phosphatase family protein [Cellulomonas sp.]|uniref:histidine phosphatase family protein n=1 Tax=Cellulomonas sp. TaxID=40001 RepID=UPI0017DD1AA9|nr:histidine phosphatase family protein [Cellulomonas sp.]NMM17289.1 histidine phosphatase family protein [Cellulomonas sp.]NMM29506.1 histidine phosphatase family protein [Cellulomonas sp.]
MRLILVRHGQTSSNVAGLLDTDEPGAGLTAVGLEQAAALADALRDESIEVLYASTLARTQQTAAPLASFLGLEVLVREGLREVRAGHLEMRGDEASVQVYLDTAFAWSSGDVHVRMPGAESGAEVFARYDAVIEEIAGSGAATAAIVSHGSVIRTWTAARARNVTADFAARNTLANTGAVLIEGSPRDGWHALAWGGRALRHDDPPTQR